MSDQERQRDRKRIDRLLDAWGLELDQEPSVEILALATKSVVLLLERRSKLLGLDAAAGSKAPEDGAEARESIVAAIRDHAGLKAVK